MEEYDEKMKAKIEEAYTKKNKNANEINQQLHDFKMNYIKRMQEEMLEGELIKRQVDDEIEREREKEEKRRDQLKANREEFNKANEDLKQVKVQEEAKARDEGVKILEFANKKEKLDRLRKEKEEAKAKEKQKEKQKLIDRQCEALYALQSKDEQILNKQVAEAEDRANRLYEEQEERKRQMKDAIEKSRQQQMYRKKAEKDSEISEQKEFAEYWKIRNVELVRNIFNCEGIC